MQMSSNENIIHAENVSKLYRKFNKPEDRLKEFIFRGRKKYSTDFWALNNVSIDINAGETVGIVGRNGSGKSTLLKMICGTVRPTTGTISVKGRISALLELGAGFNHEFTGRENIYLNASLLGLSPAEIDSHLDDILAFADIGDYIDQPVKYYSSGMFARLAFAVAVHVDPQILIIDEILAVGDAAFQRKCIERIFKIKASGCTILFVSHDAYQVKTICDRALYLKKGNPIGYGSASDIVDLYTYDIERADASAIYSVPATPVAESSASTTAHVHEEPITLAPVAEVETTTEIVAESPASPEPDLETADLSEVSPFEITSVEMIADGIRQPEEIQSGARVEFVVRYRALRKDAPGQGSFVFNLKRHDDFYICGATTLMERQPPSPLSSAGEFRVVFPSMNLLAGRYKIRFAINDIYGWQVLAERLEAAVFQVKDSYRSHGLIDMAREWHIPESVREN